MKMAEFMRSLMTRYAMYFNLKHRRVGGLFQSSYKAVTISSENQLVYLSRYIHLNPSSGLHLEGRYLLGYMYSSLNNYLGVLSQSWVKHEVVTDLFSKTIKGMTYLDFIMDSTVDEDEIGSLLID